MGDRKTAQRAMRVMIAVFVILVALSIGFGIYIYTFNHTARQYDSGQTCDDFSVTIAPRTGQTDSWPKIIEENGESVDYKGTIYDITLDNTGSCNISHWNLRIDITQDLYLNNAWCGTFEIHQNVDGKELVQTVDLRNYVEEDLIIDYKIANPDLLIPLHAGDYLIYYPDRVANEYPVYHSSTDGNDGVLTQVVFGAIFYDKEGEQLQFPSYHVEYYLQRIFTQNPFFVFLCVGFLIWFVCLVAFASVEVNLRKAHIRFKQDEHIIRQSIGVFTRFFEAKDTYTNGHSQRVAKYSRLIAEKLDFSDDKLRKIYYIALMHDCGKSYIPDSILKKPGKLTDEEYEIIKSHTVKGAEMLEDFTSIENIRNGVLYHHERYDGKGYPEGLKGEEIPLIARIICVADSFDAMNSRRCYRDMLTKEYILSEIEKNKGKQFDPKLADLFMELVAEDKIEFSKPNEE